MNKRKTSLKFKNKNVKFHCQMLNTIFLLVLQIYVNNYHKMIVLLMALIFGTAAGITAFLLMSSDDLKKFRETFITEECIKTFPMLTPSGEILENREELDAQLDVLQHRLDVKRNEIETSRNRINVAAENMEKLLSTSNEVKKYYTKLKADITRSEQDCIEIQRQIEEFKNQQIEIQERIKRNNNKLFKHNVNKRISRTTSCKSLPSKIDDRNYVC